VKLTGDGDAHKHVGICCCSVCEFWKMAGDKNARA